MTALTQGNEIMDATKIIACPGCGSNHTVSVDALIDRSPDSLDLMCDYCANDYDAAFDDADDYDYDTDREDFYLDDEPSDGFRDDVDADANALASAGWGTDEDYGGYDDFDRDFGCEEW